MHNGLVPSQIQFLLFSSVPFPLEERIKMRRVKKYNGEMGEKCEKSKKSKKLPFWIEGAVSCLLFVPMAAKVLENFSLLTFKF